MARKTVLGRGLDSLLPDSRKNYAGLDDPDAPDSHNKKNTSHKAASEGKTASNIAMISLDKIKASPGQPRKNFDEEELKELADSIAEHGIIQPIIAADAGDGTYIIVAGERRTRAAKLAGLRDIPAIIRAYTNQKQLEISLIENIQRTNLNPIEEAAGYKNLMDFSNYSQDELAQKMGKNRSTVANSLRLLKLSADIQKSIAQGGISPGHARALLAVTGKKEREKLFQEIVDRGLSVREAEKQALSLNKAPQEAESPAKAKSTRYRDPELDAMQEKFINRLGTKVVIDGDYNKGRILIDYYSMDDLERLYEILNGK